MASIKYMIKYILLCVFGFMFLLLDSYGSMEDGHIFVARYNTDGDLLWMKRDGSSDFCSGFGIAALPDNSVVVTGIVGKEALFGDGEVNETTLISADEDWSNQLYIARYMFDGSLAWVEKANGPYQPCGGSVITLAEGSIVLTGSFDSFIRFYDGDSICAELTGTPTSVDILLALYCNDGSFMWAKHAGGDRFDSASEVALLPDGSMVVAGSFENSAVFGEGEQNETTLNSRGRSDCFIAKYDPDGNLIWVKRAGGDGYDQSSDVTVLTDNSVVIGGYYKGSAIFGEAADQVMLTSHGYRNMFMARYSQEGSLIWVKNAYGVNDLSISDTNSITALSDDSIIVVGCFSNSIIFAKDEPDEITYYNGDNFDMFIARYRVDGSLMWIKRCLCTSQMSGAGVRFPDDSIAVTGYFDGTATFGLGESRETELVSAGEHDIFLAKFDANGSLIWAVQEGSSLSDAGSDLAVLQDGSIVVTGNYDMQYVSDYCE